MAKSNAYWALNNAIFSTLLQFLLSWVLVFHTIIVDTFFNLADKYRQRIEALSVKIKGAQIIYFLF
jgi:hypothetical protein